MEYKGLTLDDFQENAILAIEQNKSVVVSAPTGSGKTLIADYIIERDLKKGVRVIYTAPIKALSNQKYKEFCAAYGEQNIGLLTGDISKNPNAPVLIMTTEIYRNMAITNDEVVRNTSYVIFDEIHYINDIERGYVWEESIIFSHPNVRMLCLSATNPNAQEFARWIETISGHEVQVITHDVRPVPLHVKFYDTDLGITSLKEIKDIADIPDERFVRGRSRHRTPRIPPPNHIDLIKDVKDKLPALFFAFSRMGCQQKAEQLANMKLFTTDPKITEIRIAKLKDSPPEINKLASTKMLRHTLSQGIAFHHAGLLPVLKELVEDLFAKGLIRVLYTTETFAVGINMPAKTVCFEALRKFDGQNFRFLDSKEFFQIAGRAGRRGIDTEGHVYAMINRYDFDYGRINDMTTKDVTPIKSQFKLSVNTVINMIKQHTPQEIDDILCKSFYSFQKFGGNWDKMRKHRNHNAFDNIAKKLEKLGYLKDGKPTDKGEFLALIYADEIITGEVFATPFAQKLNAYQLLLMIGSICYERRERTEFKKHFPSEDLFKLKSLIETAPTIKDEPRFKAIVELTAILHPAFNGASFFEILSNTNFLEGDIIRFFRQIIDRIGQIANATADRDMQNKLDECKTKLAQCLRDIDVI